MELKTLKDIKKCSHALNCVKKEAIKWINEIPKERINDSDVIAIRVWIKHFFNITDEDLK